MNLHKQTHCPHCDAPVSFMKKSMSNTAWAWGSQACDACDLHYQIGNPWVNFCVPTVLASLGSHSLFEGAFYPFPILLFLGIAILTIITPLKKA